MKQASIRDLGVIGNRKAAALIDRRGRLLWYCPGRFDRPSLFAAMLDPEAGGWEVEGVALEPAGRRYIGESGVLETTVQTPSGLWTLTDWMPIGKDARPALCRELSAAPAEAEIVVTPRPEYAQEAPALTLEENVVVVNQRHYLYASHPPRIEGESIRYDLLRGDTAWFVLSDEPIEDLSRVELARWRETTLARWDEIHWQTRYGGIYERQVKDSLRALRLVTDEASGAILAAATLGLPEELGGKRNYDYRYSWLRDASMIVSALVRAGSQGAEEQRYLKFLCETYQKSHDDVPLPPFTTIDGKPAPAVRELPWRGYRESRPVLVGNGAGEQLQLGGFANVLIAAKVIYNRYDTREHWEVVEALADYLAAHWHEPDHGIWEESEKKQYTTSKVISAMALEYIAKHAKSEDQAQRWRAVSQEIRQHVEDNCLTSEGGYAAVAGSEAVDVSAALFSAWGYAEADSPKMRATIARLERDYSQDDLYWRHLESFDSRKEGAFLAGTLWVAQYWVMRGDLERAERILKAALAYSNDLGLFAEEADPRTGEMLGNIPQAFVHAALVGTVVDLKAAREE